MKSGNQNFRVTKGLRMLMKRAAHFDFEPAI